ncbi:thiamine-binding protein [Streptacidiphilus carbonis]|uniref:thiamine-binding protein n=1 Tax=Streptacidiphilus carbonis TaxID=105422 RepID=UPI000AC857F6|nr:thiamine-binding protein [Streptacidiphilus carbonis]
MRLKVEFTTEPFELDGFPDHAKAARRAVDEAGLAVDVGPFGTSAEGEAEAALAAVARLLQDTLAHGATRISLQVSALDEAGLPIADREGDGA